MEKILFLAHPHTDGSLTKLERESLAAAVGLTKGLPGSALSVGLVGPDVQTAANRLAACGASRFLGVSGQEFAVSRYASDVTALETLVRRSEATLVLAPATSRFARALPGAAHRVEGRIDAHVAGLTTDGGKLHVQRWYYRQRMVATLTRDHRPWFLLLDSSGGEPWDGAEGTVSVDVLPVSLAVEHSRTQVLGEEAASGDAQTIRPDAKVLLVAGAGWTKKQADGSLHVSEAEQLILDFLGKTQASLGGSKSLVDQTGEGQEVLSFMSHLNQVGQTGATPRHPKGLATCCHGEEPHVVGWRFITERRALNTDPGCGWAQGKADVLYVADAFAVLKRVNELLANG
jgi:electron transfer flavoprotein alpha subunit